MSPRIKTIQRFLSLCVLLLPSLSRAQQTLPFDMTTLQNPPGLESSGEGFRVAYEQIAKVMWAFYTSEAWTTIFWFVLYICMIIGVTWRAKKLMWGETEIGQLLWTFFFRVILTAPMLWWLAQTDQNSVPATMLRGYNAFASFASLRAVDNQALHPLVAAELARINVENGLWYTKIRENVGGEIDQRLTNAPLMRDFWNGFTGPEKDKRQQAWATFIYGFPTVNYLRSGDAPDAINSVNLPTTGQWQTSSKIPKPRASFIDQDDRFYGTYEPSSGGVDSPIRPFFAATIQNTREFMRKSRAVVTDAEYRAWRNDLRFYERQLLLIRYTYLRDYTVWRIIMVEPRDANGNRPQMNPNQLALLRQRISEIGNEVRRTLDNNEDNVPWLNRSWTSGLRSALMGLSYALVVFYVVVTVWGFPIVLGLSLAFWWLPEELELSGAIKKTMSTGLVILFIPVFASLIVGVADAFVQGVETYFSTGVASTVASLLTGMTVASFVPTPGDGLPVIGFLSKLATTAGAGAMSSASDVNVFTVAAWLTSFAFVLATPKIVSALMSGAGTFAEGVLGKATVGMIGGAGFGIMRASQTAGSMGNSLSPSNAAKTAISAHPAGAAASGVMSAKGGGGGGGSGGGGAGSGGVIGALGGVPSMGGPSGLPASGGPGAAGGTGGGGGGGGAGPTLPGFSPAAAASAAGPSGTGAGGGASSGGGGGGPGAPSGTGGGAGGTPNVQVTVNVQPSDSGAGNGPGADGGAAAAIVASQSMNPPTGL